MRNIVDLSSFTDKELAERLISLKTELFNLRFTHRAGSLENNNALQVCKRNIARVKTVIRQRELGLVQAPVKEEAAKKTAKTEKKTEKTETKTNKKSTKASAKVDAEEKG